MPTLTSDEQHLIDRVKSQRNYDHLVWDMTYLSAAAFFIVIGYLADAAIVGFITGTTIVLCFKCWEWESIQRYRLVYTAILEKYEQAVTGQEVSSSPTAPVTRFRFSLRTIMVVIGLVCVFFAGWTAGAVFRAVST